jgi:hypothetical protein
MRLNFDLWQRSEGAEAETVEEVNSRTVGREIFC